MFRSWGKSMGWLGVFAIVTLAHARDTTAAFGFDSDTFAFANQTVFEYHEGHASLRRPSATKRAAYNRHCFVMARAAMQFKNVARVEPHGRALGDRRFAARNRAL